MRSLNILLKFARMYDFGHPRTAKQYETAWAELRTAIGQDDAGLLLAVSGDQLLLDGTPLESAAAEKSFARMLSSAGIASIYFGPKVTQASLAKLVRGFPTGSGAKPAQVAEQIKAALQNDPHIHVNDICFVPADSAVAKTTVAAQIAARTLGLTAEQQDEMLQDPEKLLQLIMAAEGMKSSGAGPGGPGGEGGDGGPGPGGKWARGGGWGWGGGNGPGGGPGGDGGDGPAYAGSSGELVYGGGDGDGTAADTGSVGTLGGNQATGEVVGPQQRVVGRGARRGRRSAGEGGRGAASSGGGAAGTDSTQGPSSTGRAGTGTFEGPSTTVHGGAPGLEAAGSSMGSGRGPHQSSGPHQGSGSGGGVPNPWNIIGGTRRGTQVDPNAGGFWFRPGDQRESFGGRGAGVTGAENDSVEGAVSGISGPGGFEGGAAGDTSPESSGGRVPGGSLSGQFGPAGTAGSAASGGNFSQPDGPGPGPWGIEVEPTGRWAGASAAIRSGRSTRGGPGSTTVDTGLMTLQQDELQGILQVLAQIARTSGREKLDLNAFQTRLSTLPRRARFTVSQALAALVAQTPSQSTDKAMLLKLAEHIAVRYAIENFERGDLKVNAVRQLLDEMDREIGALRKVLGVYEEKMAEVGMDVPSHVELLADEFWSQVPEEKKKTVLESDEAWCVTPSRVRAYVEQLRGKGDNEGVDSVLRKYASCIVSKEPEARRRTASGLAELAPIYADAGEKLFTDTIRQVGVQLAEETSSELQSAMGAAFVRLSQEAGKRRFYPGIQKSIELIEYIDAEKPGIASTLRPRIAIENRLPEFIDEALRTGEMAGGLKDLLRRMPTSASEQIATRFSRSGFREDCDLLVSMLDMLGPEALEHLKQILEHGGPAEAINAIGILTRMDVGAVEQVLPRRMREWRRATHDRIVRQIAASGARERGRLLLEMFDDFDPLIRPLAADEIGMSGEQSADMRFLRIAEGDLSKDASEYLRLKAIEALGRLRKVAAEAALRKIAEARKAFRWAFPSELRLVAAQAMEKIDPEWVRSFVPRSGLSTAEFSIEPLDPDPNSSAIRQRRYPRLRLERPLPAITTNLKENCNLEIAEMTLGGGVALCEQSLHPGSVVALRMNVSPKSIKAQTIVRDANTQARAFEVVDIDLEERAKLRRILVQLGSTLKQASPNERNRRSTRAILPNSG
ncbi:MAG TPA: hypothetical protein VEJ67_08370 [Candidatus Cybelea sp.]|nr:hypothetical protein [Candidatus Cybelea sp.]